jgi:single-stranded DNA-binding protein
MKVNASEGRDLHPLHRLICANGDTEPAPGLAGDRAEALADSLHKGDRVYIEGSIKLNTWQKDGETRAGLSVAAWKAEKLGQIGRNKPAKATRDGEGRAPSRQGDAAQRGGPQPPADDSIPF